MTRSRRSSPGRPKTKSNLPTPIPGEPFSLLWTLRNTHGVLSFHDAARITGKSVRTIRRRVQDNKIPAAINWCLGEAIDPKLWADIIEHDNPHLNARPRKIHRVA